MEFENENIFLSLGMLSLTVAILIRRYLSFLSSSDFLEGFFIGLSITLNVFYLVKLRLKKRN